MSRPLLFTCHCLHTHCSTFAASHFYGVCFRCSYCSQMDEQQNVPRPKWTAWWNHSCYTGIPWLSALHCLQQLQSGACSSSTAQPLSPTQESHCSTPPGTVPTPHSPFSSTSSHVPVGSTRDACTQMGPLCSVASTHHATTADASMQLSTSEFLQLCFTEHPFPLRLHEDLREAQTSSNTGNSMEVTFADAATQLSFAEFFERCILSKALPSRPTISAAPVVVTASCLSVVRGTTPPPPGPLRPHSQFALALTSSGTPIPSTSTPALQPQVSTTQVRTHTARSSATNKRSASTAQAGRSFPKATASGLACGQFRTSQTCWTWSH